MNINVTQAHIPVVPTARSTSKTESATTSTYEQTSATLGTSSAANATQSASGSDVPLQAYAIPQWMSGFSLLVGSDENPGHMLESDPKYSAFASASAADLAEYSQRLQEHLQELYERNGLTDLNTRYKAMNAIPGLNDCLHAEFNASISTDTRMMGLMDKLGVSLS